MTKHSSVAEPITDRLSALSRELNPAWAKLPTYVAGLSEEAVRARYGLAHVIKLASNENPLGPGPAAREAIRRAADVASRYPDTQELEAALCRRLGIEASQLTLTSGSSEALDLLARVVLDSNSEAVAPNPSFILYPIVVQATGARLRSVPTRPDWSVDLDAVAAAITPATRLVLLGNPNNPTGLWHRTGELIQFLERVPANVLVVLDEAYFEYVSEPDYPNGITLLPRFPNLVVLRTFSKVHGLAGLRVGYSVSHPLIADTIKRARPPFNVNTIAVGAALAALDDDAHVRSSIALNRTQRIALSDALSTRGIRVVSSAANFVAAELGPDVSNIVEALLRMGVIVRPIGSMSGFVRITIGTEVENQALLTALDQARVGPFPAGPT